MGQAALLGAKNCVVVGEAIAHFHGWHEAQPGIDSDWSVCTDFSIGSTDGEVIVETTIEVHWTDGSSDGCTNFFYATNAQFTCAESTGRIGGAREGIEELIMSVNETQFSKTSVIGQRCGEIELGIVESFFTGSSVYKCVNSAGVLSANLYPCLLRYSHSISCADFPASGKPYIPFEISTKM